MNHKVKEYIPNPVDTGPVSYTHLLFPVWSLSESVNQGAAGQSVFVAAQ